MISRLHSRRYLGVPCVSWDLNRNHALSRGLVSFIPFNESPGNVVRDLFNTANKSTIGVSGTTSGVTWPNYTQYADGMCFYSNIGGGNGRPWVDFPIAPITTVNAFSVSIRALSFGVNNFQDPNTLIGVYTATRDWLWAVIIEEFTSAWKFSTHTAGGYISCTTPFSTTRVDNLVFTYDGTTMKIYKNGALASSAAQSGALSAVSGTTYGFAIFNSHATLIGNTKSTNSSLIEGPLVLWNRALSEYEVRMLHNNPETMFYKPFRSWLNTVTAPLTLTKSDSVNTLADSVTNSAYQFIAIGKGDALNLVDAIAIIGGDPFFKLQFSDALIISDALTPIFPVILKSFSDTINNLTDSVAKTIGLPVNAFDSMQFNWADALVTLFAGVLKQTPGDALTVLTDSVSIRNASVPILLAVADTVNNLNDAVRFWNVLRVITADNVVLSDAVTLRFNHLMKIAEQLTLFLESVGISVAARPAFSDSLSLSDNVSVQLAGNSTLHVGDQLNLQDFASARLIGTYNQTGFLNRIRRYLNDRQDNE